MEFIYLISGLGIIIIVLICDLKYEEKNFFGEDKGVVEKIHLLTIIISSIIAILIYFQTVYPIFTGENKLKAITKELKDVNQEKEELIGLVTSLESDKIELANLIENLKGDKKELTSSMNNLNELLKGTNRELKGVNQEKGRLISSITSLEIEKNGLTILTNSLKGDKEKLASSIENLNTQLKETNKEFIDVYSWNLFESLMNEYYQNYALKDYTNKEIKEKIILSLKKRDFEQKSPKASLIIKNALYYIQNESKDEDYSEGKFLTKMFIYCLYPYPSVKEKITAL